jgi:enoyl-CoA hydratase/carnithine racemase
MIKMDAYQEITYSVADRIATICLNRPEVRNGYTPRMADELADAFDRADRNDDVRVAIFTGAGEDFCMGMDPTSVDAERSESAVDADWREPAGRCSMRIFAMNKPVIAAIRGAAVGAGATIVLPADYRLAATDARFGYVFSRRGIIAEGASTWFLPRLVGLGRALDWMISGRPVDAAEALETGLVHSVYAPDELLAKARQLAQTIATKTAPVAVAVIRQMLYRMAPLDSPLPLHRIEARLLADSLTSADATEGFRAFLQRRDPAFKGRVSADLPDYLPWLTDSD